MSTVGYIDERFDSESGLQFLNARYYDPELGIFLSTDPAEADMNTYRYSGNDPINYSDPSGQFKIVLSWSKIKKGGFGAILGAVAKFLGVATTLTGTAAVVAGGALAAIVGHEIYTGFTGSGGSSGGNQGSSGSSASAGGSAGGGGDPDDYDPGTGGEGPHRSPHPRPTPGPTPVPTPPGGGQTPPGGCTDGCVPPGGGGVGGNGGGGIPGAPGPLESMIPVYGPGRSAVYDYENGRYGWAAFNSGLALSDLLVAKAVVTGAGKGAFKLGSHTWKATRSWYGRRAARAGAPLAKFTNVHHWLFEQGSDIGRAMPTWFVNQPWNLMPLSPQAHRGLHLMRPFDPRLAMYGMPGWAQAWTVAGAGRGVAALEDR